MTWAEIGDVALKVLAYLGGGAVIVAGLAAAVSKYIADRTIERRKAELAMEVERVKGELTKDTETHKLKLRKTELLFAKQLDAAEAFFILRDKIYPKYSFPDKDWHSVREEIIDDFTSIEAKIRAFRSMDRC
jgi:hypothetical protein